MGCYRGRIGSGVQPFPNYVNMRSELDWHNLPHTLETTVAKCRDLVKSKGYKVIQGVFFMTSGV